ncbi:SPOR domain-containing protein [Cohnella pontilimi]|uniref:SPOR domain-containing protein n=1 Tax=Cohnella pontilimi TaxID=2564100 RepID=A0A4V5LSA6_9BACL|nr:SPOR domain-containing protein [Cohnella pontilimi]TJY41449.1 SPOR domain-containing protein [Cohnella pontilimi]
MQPKTRMTFRFDPPKPAPLPQPVKLHPVPAGERKAAEPEHVQDDSKPAQPETSPSDQTTYYAGGPFQDDLYTLEQMIRTAEPIRIRQPAAESPAKMPPPEEEQTSEHVSYSDVGPAEWTPIDEGDRMQSWLSGALNRKEGPSWWRVFVSVAGAVATGALFGYLVLTLFTGDAPFPAAEQPGKDAPVQATAPLASTPASGQAVPPTATSRVQQPANSAAVTESAFYLLQYGVFRTEESMLAAMEQLKRRGLPAAADRSDGYRVYAGAADSKEEANRLAGQLSGVEVYVKPSVSPALAPNETAAALSLADFARQSAELTHTFARLSVLALQEEKPQPFDQAALSSLRQTHKLWIDSAKSTAGLTGTELKTANQLVQSLNAAMVSIDDYNRKPARYHLWNVQTAVMEAAISDRALRDALLQSTPK